jgi:hypothetical protein
MRNSVGDNIMNYIYTPINMCIKKLIISTIFIINNNEIIITYDGIVITDVKFNLFIQKNIIINDNEKIFVE